MALDPAALPPSALTFLTDPHLATLTTLRADGTPHVVAIAFTWDAQSGLARVISRETAQHVRHLRDGGRAVLCQVDGGRWLALEGAAVVARDPQRVAEAVRRYALRYRQPADNPTRVVIEVTVDRVLGRP